MHREDFMKKFTVYPLQAYRDIASIYLGGGVSLVLTSQDDQRVARCDLFSNSNWVPCKYTLCCRFSFAKWHPFKVEE